MLDRIGQVFHITVGRMLGLMEWDNPTPVQKEISYFSYPNPAMNLQGILNPGLKKDRGDNKWRKHSRPEHSPTWI